jgi:hypothetical protein
MPVTSPFLAAKLTPPHYDQAGQEGHPENRPILLLMLQGGFAHLLEFTKPLI